ncbi:MAG: hypothetical protein HDS07_00355 [Bacteroides sp.]|nr:hypothetical protein [Bacteroides sp.]
MIIVIDRPTDKNPEYSAWTADNPNGVILGTGLTVDEAKDDLDNSIKELEDIEEFKNNTEFKEYLSGEKYYYLALE